jgi:hypothetical protein
VFAVANRYRDMGVAETVRDDYALDDEWLAFFALRRDVDVADAAGVRRRDDG